MENTNNKKEIKFSDAVLPIVAVVIIMLGGLIIYPNLTGNPAFSLEIIFILASIVSILNLLKLGYKWKEIESSIYSKLKQLMPAALILFSIGILIGAWVLSGTIPMLIYYGIDIISPKYIYLTGFLVPWIFSMLTGTSWGAAGTIGVVIMSIGAAIDANLAILAGAVVGGSYAGDKLSPLSDTTNIAALATDVPLMDHVRSMMNTTLPAGILAAVVYFALGMNLQVSQTATQLEEIDLLQKTLSELFVTNGFIPILLMLLPVIIVLYGSLRRMPTVPVLIISSLSAVLVGFIVQNYDFGSGLNVLINGFVLADMTDVAAVPEKLLPSIERIVNRGGLYSMAGPVIISMSVFIFVSTLDLIDAMPMLVNRFMRGIKTRAATIISALAATAMTNGITSNQFATSFTVAEAFKPKFKEQMIPKRVLSRSIEDCGTMIENVLPWTTTGIYMTATLGVSTTDYAMFQFITIFGIIIAIGLAITGKGCFYELAEEEYTEKEVVNYEEKQAV